MLLLMCAGPKAHHILRNLPPSEGVSVLPGRRQLIAGVSFTHPCCGFRRGAVVSEKEGWVFGALRDWHQRPIGHLGKLFVSRCTHEHHLCVLSEDLLRRAQCVREAQDAATLLAREGMEVPRIDPEVESGLTVGNFTHQLLATPFFQTTDLCGHRNEVLCFAPLQLSAHMSADHLFG